MSGDWIIWGSELSPFTLKLIRLFRHARLPLRFLPAEGSFTENWHYALRVDRLKRGMLPLTCPAMTEDDEFPLVPFVFGPEGENLYDSSAIARWLDARLEPALRVIPGAEAASFVARLIDDYADEWGLYLVHHNRWKVSALDNDAGTRVAREFRFTSLGLLQFAGARWFAARQTRRLAYLFSVAPEGFHINGLPASRQPPSRAGFPPTHELLEHAHLRLLDILETLLANRPYLLGGMFTLADAAIYGQLGMNLSDPSADRLMRERAPHVHAWLTALHGADPSPIPGAAENIQLDAGLKPLLAEICRTHVALMRQNAEAVARLHVQGQRRFNERAFNRGEALYDGVIDGFPFRHVAKTFQARVWRDCLTHRSRLSSAARAQVDALLPANHGIDGVAA
ncbi:MAG TPA: glutathione S-transferase C-terminal domain-containing protein [Nevskiaceae bacterium]|nr:glutathione S-transferase C-terminal domain-containing protein [Nevskiaceae bacterium]